MNSLLKSRLFRQQFLVLAGLMVFFFAFMVSGILLRTRSAIENREAEIVVAYRDAVTSSLDSWLSERESDIAFLTAVLEDAEGLSLPQDGIEPFLEFKPGFSDFVLIGLDGLTLYNRYGRVTSIVSLADREYFKAALEGRTHVSEAFANRLTGRYTLAISRPIREGGSVVGVFAGFVLVADMARIVEGMGLRELGSVYIVDSDRRLIAGSVPDSGLDPEGPAEEPAALDNRAARLDAQEFSDVRVTKTGTEVDFLVDAFNAMSRAVRNREIQLREAAARDSLTGLYNHAG